MPSKLYCYHTMPIDFWLGALTPDAIERSIDGIYGIEQGAVVRQEIAELRARSEVAFAKIGWEGDVRDGPYFFAVPGEVAMRLGYALKQDNNGNCFVSSPIPLPNGFIDIIESTVIG